MIEKKRGFKRRPFKQRERDEFEQRIVDLRRVTRVMAGGKRMRFRACVVIGDHKGQIGYGLAKGKDVAIAVNKAVSQAKNRLLKLEIVDGTIAHQVVVKYKAAQVMLRPAPDGTGIIAGGAVRAVLELSGIKNISAKILGSNNKVNIVKAVFEALTDLKPRKPKEVELVDKKPVVEKKAKLSQVQKPSPQATSRVSGQAAKAKDGKKDK